MTVSGCLFAILLISVAVVYASVLKNFPDSVNEACKVYCDGPLLQAVQLARIFPDSKTFVDMPMKYSPSITLSAFYAIPDPTDVDLLTNFLNDYFYPAGSDVIPWSPVDYNPNPAFIKSMPDDFQYKSWASDLNMLWSTLGRQVSPQVALEPSQHSLVPRSHPMIVPGGRFRESYYWDSYWIVRGLLVCDMHVSALYVIQNLLDDIRNFGFVPNGGRIYYLDRSQPPLLSAMVVTYYQYCLAHEKTCSGDLGEFVHSSFALLEQEYKYWMSTVTSNHFLPSLGLNRHYSAYTTPRPESFVEDYTNNLASPRDGEDGGGFYRAIRGGAETGWDFSSRWIGGDEEGNRANISYIDTTNVVPVDLNVYLFNMEKNLAYLSKEGGVKNGERSAEGGADGVSQRYLQCAEGRASAIHKVLYDPQLGVWRDFNLTSNAWVEVQGGAEGEVGGKYFHAAQFLPLWFQTFPSDMNTSDITAQVLQTFSNSGLVQEGGVLTSTLTTGQQWDAPNAWPPLVLLTIEGLARMDDEQAKESAATLASTWLASCYTAYNETGYMYEKYDALAFGHGGGGGEYVPQVGFGWSNAVALVLIDQAAKML
eukprot:gene32712-39547_t